MSTIKTIDTKDTIKKWKILELKIQLADIITREHRLGQINITENYDTGSYLTIKEINKIIEELENKQ